MIRTFVDSGALIAAARSLDPDGERALKFLDDPNRVFLTSPFVYLEVVLRQVLCERFMVPRSREDRGCGTNGSSQSGARGDGRPPLGSSPPILRGRVHHH